MKTITLTQEQQDDLLAKTLKAFKESGLVYSIRIEKEFWAELLGYYPLYIQRLEGTTYELKNS